MRARSFAWLLLLTSTASCGKVRALMDRFQPKPARSVEEVPWKGSARCEPGKNHDYPVGPGQKYAAIGEVPLEALEPGDTVRVFHRPEPYREKIMIGGSGKKDAPIRLCGVPGPNGELPVIDGKDATTRKSLDFPFDGHQPRGLVIVGHKHGDPWKLQPEYIEVEGLEVRGAKSGNRFTDKAGAVTEYSEIATGIYVQRGSHIVLRGNVVHDNGNGLFVGGGGGDELSEDILIEGNYVWGNGSAERHFEHNVYNEAAGVTYQFNRFGPPVAGPNGTLGANIKERSAGVVVRYNWIEDGAHLIDLVEAQEAKDRTLSMPSYRETWVYGNVLVRGQVPNGSLVHYGGDSGQVESYRKGTLHFVANTVLIENAPHARYQGTAVFELTSNEESLDARNNVIWFEDAPHPTRPVALLGARDGVAAGRATLAGNWLREGIQAFDGMPGKEPKREATMEGFDGSTFGAGSPFVDAAKRDLRLGDKTLRGKGVALDLPAEHALSRQYAVHGSSVPRSDDAPTPGAFGE